MEKEMYWSKFADDFEERNNRIIGSDMLIVKEKVKELAELKDCLELGCGNGTYTKLLSPIAKHILATDFSDEMVVETKKRLSSFTNITVEKANCLQLHYQKNSFDTVFMANLLHVIPTPIQAIQQVYRVLKPQGKLVILSYTTEDMTFFNKLRMVYSYLKAYGKPSKYAYTLKMHQAKEMLLSAGFIIEANHVIGQRMKAIFIQAIKK